MTKLMRAVAFLFVLGGCSTANIQSNIVAFENGVAAVDARLALFSASLTKNCASIENDAQAIAAADPGNAIISQANTGLIAYCQIQSPPADVAGAISSTVLIVQAVRAERAKLKAAAN